MLASGSTKSRRHYIWMTNQKGQFPFISFSNLWRNQIVSQRREGGRERFFLLEANTLTRRLRRPCRGTCGRRRARGSRFGRWTCGSCRRRRRRRWSPGWSRRRRCRACRPGPRCARTTTPTRSTWATAIERGWLHVGPEVLQFGRPMNRSDPNNPISFRGEDQNLT